ncbi:transcriptional regulator with XRE-family HTH domain [Nakamurella sp. UYEF19]|uniref:helix-turn-helix domain-containing protein n=1 Tax=Nakamurella sp. UYEF19 TaxID=1756392 RepID=UPI00339787A8
MPEHSAATRQTDLPAAVPDPDHHTGSQEARLGRQIRHLRHQHGLTLVALARMTSLSHPFLSQLERGLARPSMTSLGRIAQALHSSQSELMARATDEALDRIGPPFTVVRADEGTVLPAPGGSARLLVGSAARFHPMVYLGSNTEFEEYYQHPEDEFVHIIEGSIEVDLGEREHLELTVGDSLYYGGGTPHRWRTIDGAGYRLLAVKEASSPTG